jgi:hypothetical protein
MKDALPGYTVSTISRLTSSILPSFEIVFPVTNNYQVRNYSTIKPPAPLLSDNYVSPTIVMVTQLSTLRKLASERKTRSSMRQAKPTCGTTIASNYTNMLSGDSPET